MTRTDSKTVSCVEIGDLGLEINHGFHGLMRIDSKTVSFVEIGDLGLEINHGFHR